MELDFLSVLGLVARHLDAQGIPYMLSGSSAMSFYAQPRTTRDLDIVVALPRTKAHLLMEALATEFECDVESMLDAIARESLFCAIHVQTLVKVDFVALKSAPFRREEFSRRRTFKLSSGQQVSVVTPEDLVLSKLVWGKPSGSELQMRDARNILKTSTGLDAAYLERWAAELGITAELEEARR